MFREFGKNGKKGAISHYAVVALVAFALSILLVLFTQKTAVIGLSTGLETQTKEVVADLRAALVFADQNVYGIKYLDMRHIFSVTLLENEVIVRCEALLCTRKYEAKLAHNVNPNNLITGHLGASGIICVLKKAANEKVMICPIEDEACCKI